MAGLNSDAHFSLRFSQDKTQVFVDISPPNGGGKNVTSKEIVSALQARGVTYGFQFDAIEQAIKFVASNAAPMPNILAAQGLLPVPGTDAQILWKIDPAKVSEPLPMTANGLPDYFNYDPARLVKAGQELATVVPGTPGSPGKTLVPPFESIPQAPGRDCPVILGTGVSLKTNPHRYQADVPGCVEFHNGRLSVRALSLIDGDLVGGEHAFPGGLVVLGAVRDAAVRARGPIAVRGPVSQSDLRAGNHVLIEHAEQTRIVADGDIHVVGHLIDCEVITPERIIGGDLSLLKGGSVTAAVGIDAGEIGGESRPVTLVTLGSFEYAAIRIHEIERDIKEAEASVWRISIALKPLRSIMAEPISPAKRALMETLLEQKNQLEQHVRNLHAERRSRQMAHYSTDGRIRVTGRLYPGVRLDLYGARLDICQQKTAVDYQRSVDGKSVEAANATQAAA